MAIDRSGLLFAVARRAFGLSFFRRFAFTESSTLFFFPDFASELCVDFAQWRHRSGLVHHCLSVNQSGALFALTRV